MPTLHKINEWESAFDKMTDVEIIEMRLKGGYVKEVYGKILKAGQWLTAAWLVDGKCITLEGHAKNFDVTFDD